MNIRLLVSIVVIFACPVLAYAESPDAAIYSQTLKVLLDHDKPKNFAVWSKTIDPVAMTTPRVPRHEPMFQFSRELRGLSKDMEKVLTTPESGNTGATALPSIVIPTSAAHYWGTLDRNGVAKASREINASDFADQLLVVGLSKIVYGKSAGNNAQTALLYSEVCLHGAEDNCGAEAFWYVASGSSWRLKMQRYLWQGTTTPFWNMSSAAGGSDLSSQLE
jgi:hypothetical protein